MPGNHRTGEIFTHVTFLFLFVCFFCLFFLGGWGWGVRVVYLFLCHVHLFFICSMKIVQICKKHSSIFFMIVADPCRTEGCYSSVTCDTHRHLMSDTPSCRTGADRRGHAAKGSSQSPERATKLSSSLNTDYTGTEERFCVLYHDNTHRICTNICTQNNVYTKQKGTQKHIFTN